jgi:hypothetical protein
LPAGCHVYQSANSRENSCGGAGTTKIQHPAAYAFNPTSRQAENQWVIPGRQPANLAAQMRFSRGNRCANGLGIDSNPESEDDPARLRRGHLPTE